MDYTKLRLLKIDNFKGLKHFFGTFSDFVEIFGRNATGKSSLVDAIMWLFFDKDRNGNSNFAIRTKDEEGRDIDNIEIVVEAVLEQNSVMLTEPQEITLRKVQKQKWVKKRGRESQTFEGNENSFFINDFPVKKSEYEQRINSIIDEALFKLLTSPKTFASMKWQDQRKILLKFVSEITDEEMLAKDEKKYAPIKNDVLMAGADKAKEKATSLLRDLKKQQAEFPVRIDELSKMIVEVEDEADLLQTRRSAEAYLEEVQAERDDLHASLEKVNEVQAEIMSIKLAMGKLESDIADKNNKRLMEAAQNAQSAKAELRKLTDDFGWLQSKQDKSIVFISDYEAELETVRKEYREAKERSLSADEKVCPTCGREFDAGRIADIEKSFDERKEKDMKRLREKGDTINANIKTAKANVEKIQAEIDDLQPAITAKENECLRLDDAFKNLPQLMWKETDEYKDLALKMKHLEEALASMDGAEAQKEALAAREKRGRETIQEADRRLAIVESNKRTEERIHALESEQRECSQKVAYQEKIVYLLEEYVKQKMDVLSELINGKFSHVRFRLFEKQINGAIKETCTMQINSNGSYVDYYDANSAAQIIGGLDVIDALSKLYGTAAPIFIDNAESINIENIPKMDAQMILLTVSDDKELVISND